MPYTGQLPTGGWLDDLVSGVTGVTNADRLSSSTSSGGRSAPIPPGIQGPPNVVPSPSAVMGKYADNYSDWPTVLTKAGLNVAQCMVVIPYVTHLAKYLGPETVAGQLLGYAVQNALRDRGYPVERTGSIEDGSVEDKVLTQQFNSDWGAYSWGALVLGSLAAPRYTGPGSVVTAKTLVPIAIGVGALYLIFRKK